MEFLPKTKQGHGEDDLIIQLEWARRAAEVLRPRSESLEFKTYKGVGHMISDMQVIPQELHEISLEIVQNFKSLTNSPIANC